MLHSDFAACVESGPLARKLADDLRRDLGEAEKRIARGGDDGQWARYSVRFAERQFIERLQRSFDLTRRSAAELPAPIRTLVNELAVRVARMTGEAPDPTFETLWTAETRAHLPDRHKTVQLAMATRQEDESAVIGRRFVEVYYHGGEVEDASRPVSAEQYARIGQYQLKATECLTQAPNPARAAAIHNEMQAWRDELVAQGEEVSPDLHTLQNDLLHAMLDAGA